MKEKVDFEEREVADAETAKLHNEAVLNSSMVPISDANISIEISDKDKEE